MRLGQTRVIDVRRQQSVSAPRTRKVNGRTVQRDPSTITGVVIHQTAVCYGVPEHLLNRYHGDRGMALAHRALAIPAHAVAFRSGVIAIPHRLESYTYHANKLNASTLGLEIEGVYPGLSDDPDTPRREDLDTLWGDDDRRTPLDMLTTVTIDRALCLLVNNARDAGMPLKYIYAHRQSSASRRADPGQEIWEAIADTARVLWLEPRPDYTVGDGKPIPDAWGGSKGVRY